MSLQPSGPDASMLALLERIALAVEQIAAHHQAVAPAALEDRLLRAVDRLLDGAPFTAARLIELTQDELSTRSELRHLLAPIVDDLTAPGAGRRLGRWLSAREGHVTACGELRLENPQETREGKAYRVVRTAALPASFARETRKAFNGWPSLTESSAK